MLLSLEVSEERDKELNQIMTECGMHSYQDLFNNALTLFMWAARERKQRRIIASVDEENAKYREAVLEALENILKK